jgi:hypothetical protein
MKTKSRLERFREGEEKLEKIRKEYKSRKNTLSQTEIIRQMRDNRAMEIWERLH